MVFQQFFKRMDLRHLRFLDLGNFMADRVETAKMNPLAKFCKDLWNHC